MLIVYEHLLPEGMKLSLQKKRSKRESRYLPYYKTQYNRHTWSVDKWYASYVKASEEFAEQFLGVIYKQPAAHTIPADSITVNELKQSEVQPPTYVGIRTEDGRIL